MKLDLNVMTFNIRQSGDRNADGTYSLDGENGWHHRAQAVIGYINQSQMDVLCLQEVKQGQSEDIFAELNPRYQGVYYARRKDLENPEGLMVIFDQTKYRLVDSQIFWLSPTPHIPSLGWGANYYRICMVVTLCHKQSGQTLTVFNLHLDHQAMAARVNGLQLVMEKVTATKGPCIVAGDFNTHSQSPCYGIIARQMTDCQSVASNVGITYHGWGEDDDGFSTPVDFIFVTRGALVKKYTLCQDMWRHADGTKRYYSDHYAVSSTIELG